MATARARAKLVKIVLPAAAPGILVGLRTALGQAWMAVVAAEIFGVTGLGQRMMQASSLLATDIVVVYMITMAALYGIIDTAFVLLVQDPWILRMESVITSPGSASPSSATAAAPRCCAGSTSPSAGASSWPSSGRRASASRRCCG